MFWVSKDDISEDIGWIVCVVSREGICLVDPLSTELRGYLTKSALES